MKNLLLMILFNINMNKKCLKTFPGISKMFHEISRLFHQNSWKIKTSFSHVFCYQKEKHEISRTFEFGRGNGYGCVSRRPVSIGVLGEDFWINLNYQSWIQTV